MSASFRQSIAQLSLLFFILVVCLPLMAQQDNPPAPDKKQLEANAKQVAEEGKALEAKAQLRGAEEKYLAAESITSTHEGAEGLERVRKEKAKKVQSLLAESHSLYDAGKPQEAESKLEEAGGLDPGNP